MNAMMIAPMTTVPARAVAWMSMLDEEKRQPSGLRLGHRRFARTSRSVRATVAWPPGINTKHAPFAGRFRLRSGKDPEPNWWRLGA
jgi:hypothetical protein